MPWFIVASFIGLLFGVLSFIEEGSFIEGTFVGVFIGLAVGLFIATAFLFWGERLGRWIRESIEILLELFG